MVDSIARTETHFSDQWELNAKKAESAFYDYARQLESKEEPELPKCYGITRESLLIAHREEFFCRFALAMFYWDLKENS